MGSNQCDRFFRIPVARADHPRDHPALAVQQHAGRQPRDLHGAGQRHAVVEMQVETVHAELFQERLGHPDAAPILADRQNGEVAAALLGLQPVERGHLLHAGRAPCRPEVHQHRASAEIRQGALVSGRIEENRVRRWQRRVDAGKLPGPLDALRVRGQGRRRGKAGRGKSQNQPGQCDGNASHAFLSPRLRLRGQAMTSNTMWGGRFVQGPAEVMQRINASIDFDRRLYAQDIAGSKAHARMLVAQGIIQAEDGAAIQDGLDRILEEIEAGSFEFKTALEDIHLNIESRLAALIGDAAGRLHTARSRNDQVATDLRLWLREAIDALDAHMRDLQAALLDQAETHAGTVMPGFTHLQPAQPVTFGHHLLAYVEMTARDRGRLADCRRRLNELPLGAAALAGTSFPIDRRATASELGFDRPMANSLDAVSARDFVLEFLAAASIAATHLSRLAEEIVLWCGPQFGFIKLSDAFTTGSSIMPQKRNPDAAELVRAKTGRMNGNLIALLTVMKGLPLAYNKDMQEDKAAMFESVDALSLCLAATASMIEGMTVNADVMADAAEGGYATATELADWMVQTLGVPFRDAHHATGAAVKMAENKGVRLDQLTLADLQTIDPRITEDARSVLSAPAALKRRKLI